MTRNDDELARGGAHDLGSQDVTGSPVTGSQVTGEQRTTIPRPADEQVVYRADPDEEVIGAQRSKFDLPATIGGALAALGTLLLLSSLLGALGTIGFQTGVDGQDLSIGGLIAGLVTLFLACLIGGWVAGRMARRRGGLHGLVSALWLVLLAAALAALAALAGDKYDVTERVGLPGWFSSDAAGAAAIGTGLLALALMLLGGYLGGLWGDRNQASSAVQLVETRHKVSERPGGIRAQEGRR